VESGLQQVQEDANRLLSLTMNPIPPMNSPIPPVNLVTPVNYFSLVPHTSFTAPPPPFPVDMNFQQPFVIPETSTEAAFQQPFVIPETSTEAAFQQPFVIPETSTEAAFQQPFVIPEMSTEAFPHIDITDRQDDFFSKLIVEIMQDTDTELL